MKVLRFDLIAAMFVVLLLGCAVETVVTTGIVAENAKNQAQALRGVTKQAGQQIGLSQVRQAITSFQAMQGRYPHTLDELVVHGYLYHVPELPAGKQYAYNNVTGEAKIVRVQNLPAPQFPQQPVPPQQGIPPTSQRRPVYGGSPYMQQFQIQHEFQYGNQAHYSGAASANLGAKRQLGNIQRNYQQQQNKYLNELTP
ncbi:unnamed protein product [marine sediment metagenome]|uniref:Type II secretion system protein GspG C-terminal domain-containing protein n=1 Tax=marine sediment metagenome TaxID=412755 RepID=X0URG3_9ZZZZ